MSFFSDAFSAFASFGPLGMLAALFIVVFFDAIIVPIGPELLAIAIFYTNLDATWAVFIIITVALGQICGTTFLYLLGKHPKMLPNFMRNIMNKYREFLLIQDEKIVFVNCFVPILPFLGAFIAISNWDYKKTMAIIALGGIIKYSIFLSMSKTFHYLFEQGIAQKVSLLVVLALLITSGLYAVYRRKKFERKKSV